MLGPVLWGVGFFIFSLIYLMARRGTCSIFLINKCAASAAFLLYAIAFIALAKKRCNKPVMYSAYAWAITGHSFLLTHIVLTLVFLQNKFPFPAWYIKHWFVATCAVVATFGLFLVPKYIYRLFPHVKINLELIVFIGYAAALLHMSALKYTAWCKWLTKFHPIQPPLSLLTALFGWGVLLVYSGVTIYKYCQNKPSIGNAS